MLVRWRDGVGDGDGWVLRICGGDCMFIFSKIFLSLGYCVFVLVLNCFACGLDGVLEFGF